MAVKPQDTNRREGQLVPAHDGDQVSDGQGATLKEIEAVDVAAWLTREGLGGPPWRFSSLPGGTQNLMVRAVSPTGRVVLRSGPRHLRPRSNDTIEREVRLLTALASTGVPHPRLLGAAAPGFPLPGRALYAMGEVRGVNASVTLSLTQARSSELRHGMGLAMVDALCALHEVDPSGVGLAGFGEPDTFLQRQVPRWLAEFTTYRGVVGDQGLPDVDLEKIVGWLEAHRPAPEGARVVHGDYQLSNVLFENSGTQIVAILDWELATLADPLVDLGWLLATWPQTGIDIGWRGLAVADGLASESELVARYGERTGRDTTAVPWFAVLACFKLAVILEGTYARSLAGSAPRAVGDRLHRAALDLFAQALRRIAQA